MNTKKVVLTNGKVWTGELSEDFNDSLSIVIENDKISSIYNDDSWKENEKDAEIIDLNGSYLLPGLINAHVHLPGSGKPSKNAKDPKTIQALMANGFTRWVLTKCCEKYAKQSLLSGVTTIRTVGGLGTVDSTIRNKINSGKTIGPRMLVCDMAVTCIGGHMGGVLAYEGATPEECSDLVRKVVKDGNPDWIKLMITGGVLDAKVKGEPGVLKMTLEQVKAACDTAHELGRKVCAHVESPLGVEVALKGGVDTVEHGAILDEEKVRLFKEKGAALITTLSPAIPLSKMDAKLTGGTELTQYNGTVVLDGILNASIEGMKQGIPVGLGTDSACPFVAQYDFWREVNYLNKMANVPLKKVLWIATHENARILGIDKETGSIEKGKSADLIVVKENPFLDARNLTKLSDVFIKGERIHNPKLKKNKLIEEALDTVSF